MGEQAILESLTQFGFAGVVFVALFVILKWMMKLHDKVMSDSKEERIEWRKVIGEMTDKLHNHTIEAKSFHETVSEANRYQREEHKELSEKLDSIEKKIK